MRVWVEAAGGGWMGEQFGSIYAEDLINVYSILSGIPTRKIVPNEIQYYTSNWPKGVCSSKLRI